MNNNLFLDITTILFNLQPVKIRCYDISSFRLKTRFIGIEMMLASVGSPCGLDTHAGSKAFLQGSSSDYAEYATGSRGVFFDHNFSYIHRSIALQIHFVDSNDCT